MPYGSVGYSACMQLLGQEKWSRTFASTSRMSQKTLLIIFIIFKTIITLLKYTFLTETVRYYYCFQRLESVCPIILPILFAAFKNVVNRKYSTFFAPCISSKRKEITSNENKSCTNFWSCPHANVQFHSALQKSFVEIIYIFPSPTIIVEGKVVFGTLSKYYAG